MKKCMIVPVFLLLLVPLFLTITATAAEIVDSGYCGKESDGTNLTWTLDAEGMLTINGTGAMKDYFTNNAYSNPLVPWHNSRSMIKSLTISDGVTSVGSCTCYGCRNLTSVTISNSVTQIGNFAFSDCSKLTYIVIPDSVTRIDNSAFEGCRELTNMTIPNSVTRLGNLVFSGCRKLTDVVIPDSITHIGEWTFSNCSGLTDLVIPNSITTIHKGTFAHCSGLTNLTIPGSVTSVSDSAFEDCSGLISVTILDSLNGVGEYAFYRCNKLTNVTIPNSFIFISNHAFGGCSSLESVIIPDSVTGIGDFSFANCSNLTSITIGNSVTSIGTGAFVDCNHLTSVIIPDSVISIGDSAFEKCDSLTQVKIGNSVTTIGSGVFAGCGSLKQIKVGAESQSFTSLDGVLLNKQLTMLLCYPSGKSGTFYKIPESVIAIWHYAFYDCSSLTSVTLPNGVIAIGNLAFFNCGNLTSMTLPDSVIYIGNSAFSKCSNLTSMRIPYGVHSIADYAFFDCSSLTSVTIPDSVTSIGEMAFLGCSGLTSITIPDSAISIGYSAFGRNLTDVYYTGTEAQWNAIDIDYNLHLQWATIHYKSAGPTPPALAPVQTRVSSGQYCIHVVDENGQPLKGANVYWEDSAETLTADTDDNGDAFFASFTLGTPKIDVSLSGYISWTNRNSNWSKSDKRYSEVILYDEAHGAYKLASAYYSNVGSETSWYNLLTTTKKINLKNDGNLIGDLDFGNFYLTCTACTTQGIDRYELWQNDKQISQCADRRFPRLSVTSFSKGDGCFVRVIAETGEEVDTAINLQFAENKVKQDTSVKFGKNGISITIADDDIPYFGGSTIDINTLVSLPANITVTEDKIRFELNTKPKKDREEAKKQFDILRGFADESKRYYKDRTKRMKGLIADEEAFDLPGGKFKVYVCGYGEADFGSSVLQGEVYFLVEAQTQTFGFNTVVVIVPVTVQIKAELEAQVGGKIKYNWTTEQLDAGIHFDVTLGLGAFAGVGIGEVVGVGAYGKADVEFDAELGTNSQVNKVDLTGELGLKAYVSSFEYHRAFAHNTWHLYTPNNVKGASLQSALSPWNSGLYDAASYEIADLSYLSAESDWQGGAVLMQASARTELLPLLSDTYRNARPVMVATDNDLYAAFVRADVGNEQRYVVVTKFDGSSWQEPVRVDANAVLDSAPTLFTNGNSVYLAYARTTENPGDSLLSYALKQEIIVGSINPDTLSFTKQATFSGIAPDTSFVSMPQLSAVNGQTLLAWMDSTVSDDNSVLRPASGVVRYAICSDGAWGNASDMGTVNAPVDSITIGERNAAPAIACLLDEDSGRNLYLLTASGQERIAENVSGTVAYARLPGTDKASFLWNGENVLTSSDGNSAEVPGISGEYAVSGNNIYYSAATEESANLTVLQYHTGSGTWGLPIQLTDESRYLENLSVASLNGTDYALGMHTAATITENAVEDAKNLVWSAVKPVSNLRLDGIDYDAENVKAGESLPVTLAVINAGDHTVNRVAVTLNNSAVKTQECSLTPGESLDMEVAVPVSESLSECLFAVAEPEKDDYSPDNNKGTVKIGYADAAIELEYQRIGTKKALMASVTNQGIEAASGNIVFYDANGSSVAESSFTDLASGDTTIAVYELDENFAGINGGDVSARVTLEQEELYTYNNADTLHIMEAGSNPEKTEIVSAVANGERGLSADIACESELAATAYCAFYNSDGKMLSVEIRPLSTGRNSLTFTASDQAASKAKIFVLDNQLIPQCASETVEVT